LSGTIEGDDELERPLRRAGSPFARVEFDPSARALPGVTPFPSSTPGADVDAGDEVAGRIARNPPTLENRSKLEGVRVLSCMGRRPWFSLLRCRRSSWC
jgi:hypothetical protein